MARCRFLIKEKSISLNKKIFFFSHQILVILYSWLRLPFTHYSIEKPTFKDVKNSFCINLGIQRLTPPTIANYTLIPTRNVSYKPSLCDCWMIFKYACVTRSFTQPLYHIYYHFFSSLKNFPDTKYVCEDSGSIFQKAFIQVCHDNNIQVECYMSCFIHNICDALFDASTGSSLITNQRETISLFHKNNLLPPRYLNYESSTFSGKYLELPSSDIDHYSLVFPHFYKDKEYCKNILTYSLKYFSDPIIPIAISLHPQCKYLEEFLLGLLQHFPGRKWFIRPNSWTDHYFIASSILIVGSDSSLYTLAASYSITYILIDRKST